MASKKQERLDRLAATLQGATGWVTGTALAKMLGTSERSVRTYVGELNAGGSISIESSREGYRLARSGVGAPEVGRAPSSAAATPAGATPTIDARVQHVITRLVGAAAPLSAFELADELFISESTLASGVMPRARRLLAQFNLACETHDFNMALMGKEADKRRLLGYLATHGNYGYFTSTRTLEEMFPAFDVPGIMSRLVDIFQRAELFINDYALSNLLVHLLVIIIRLTGNNGLGEREQDAGGRDIAQQLEQGTAIMACAGKVACYFEDEFGCSIPDADFQQIVLLIALSIERYDYAELDLEKLTGLMDRSFVDMVIQILTECGQRYSIPPVIDEQMRLQLILHMHNAYQRAIYRVSYPNPLAGQIKREYAPVYDMAVFIAHRFSQVMDIELCENEIAFIAFHIGAYFERASVPAGTVTAVVIVEEYHDFAQRLVEDLRRALEGDVAIVGVMSYDGYLASRPEADVVIATIDVPVERALKILIGPILTKQNLRKVRDGLADLLEERRRREAAGFLQAILRPELYLRNRDEIIDATSAISLLGALARKEGLADEAFVEDVLLREQVSSTAFTDRLAVPHAIGKSPERSFISVLHNEKAIPWGRHDVNFVLLIGIADADMRHFRDALDLIIDTFSDIDRVMRLMQTTDFAGFSAALS